MTKRRDKIKRTKTFTGCLTCRSRSVKCGEEKPACLRCRNALLQCRGYNVVLIWPGCTESKGSQRMSLLANQSRPFVKTVSADTISYAITTLDTVPHGTCCSIGLFGVFPTNVDAQPLNSSFSSRHSDPSDKHTQEFLETEDAEYEGSLSASGGRIPFEIERYKLHENNNHTTLAHCILPKEDVYHPEPSLYNSSPISSQEERQLMHYWINYLSPLLMPVRSHENPFQTVMVPLALSALQRTENTAGTYTLLNSLFACAAVIQGNLGRAEYYGMLGAKYLQSCFQCLRQSLSETATDSPEAVLSAIIVLLIIGIFNADATNWRIHLNGAIKWLRSIKRSAWSRDSNSSTIYDLFLCLEALRPAQRTLALELQPCNLYLEDTVMRQSEFPDRDMSRTCRDRSYSLDFIFGIKQPFLEVIIQINSWVYSGCQPSTSEMQDLEMKIILNDPDIIPLSCHTTEERLIQLYAHLFHVTTSLYFSRLLQNSSLCTVQHLVRRSIEYLDEIGLLEQGMNVSGLLWPAFITGCEANEEKSRSRIDAYFDKRETLGIGNVKDARKVVHEVWRRRDTMRGLEDVTWHEVMADLGIDILLS